MLVTVNTNRSGGAPCGAASGHRSRSRYWPGRNLAVWSWVVLRYLKYLENTYAYFGLSGSKAIVLKLVACGRRRDREAEEQAGRLDRLAAGPRHPVLEHQHHAGREERAPVRLVDRVAVGDQLQRRSPRSPSYPGRTVLRLVLPACGRGRHRARAGERVERDQHVDVRMGREQVRGRGAAVRGVDALHLTRELARSGASALIVFHAQSVRLRPCASERFPIRPTTGALMLSLVAPATAALPTSIPACLCENSTFCVAPARPGSSG